VSYSFIENPKTLVATTLAKAADVNLIVNTLFNGLQDSTKKISIGQVEAIDVVADTVEADSFIGDLTGNVTGNVTGNLTGNVTGDVTGNAGTVTNGVYTTGNQTIGGSKTFSSTIQGSVSGNAGTVTNGVYTTGNQSISGSKSFASDIVVNSVKVGTVGTSASTVFGNGALGSNTSGDYNTAVGWLALRVNSSGIRNSALGSGSLYSNTTGSYNTAFGSDALVANTSGNDNTAVGYHSLSNNTSNSNTAVGRGSLYANTSGGANVAVGYVALNSNISGYGNTAVGGGCLTNVTTGSNNTAIGYNTNVPEPTGWNQVRIGNFQVTYAGVNVAWTITSDIKYKTNINTSILGLDFINKLRPVEYLRKGNEDGTKEMGLIAQEVKKVLDDEGIQHLGIIKYNKSEDSLELRYNDLIPVLIKAIQEQQQQIEELKTRVKVLET